MKAKHEATIVEGKAIESKGGSIRYTLRGEYKGRKTLPKTVSKADFEGIYGFDAKAAEGELTGVIALTDDPTVGGVKSAKVITERGWLEGGIVKEIIPMTMDDPYAGVDEAVEWAEDLKPYSKLTHMKYNKDKKEAEGVYLKGKNSKEPKQDAMFYKVGQEDADGFTPEKIVPIRTMNEHGTKKLVNAMKEADTVGSPSPASVEPSAPSEKPFPQEPSNENFSAHIDLGEGVGECISCATLYPDEDDTPSICDCGGEIRIGTDDYAYEPTDEEMAEIWEREQKMRDMEPTELLEDDDYTTLEGTLEKEAFGFGKEEESEEPKEQEFTVVLQEGDKLELTDIEEDTEGDVTADEPKEEYNDSNEENEEKDAESNQDIKWNNVKEQADAKCPFCFRSAFRLIGEEGEEFSVYEEDIAGDNWLLECSRCKAEWNQDGENTLDGGYTGNAESENEEKEAESNVRVFVVSSVDYETDGQDLDLRQDFTFALDKDDIGDTTDMQEIADEIIDDISDETGFLVNGFYFQEKMPDGTLVDLNAEYEAVSAKVTRPVKEDETEEDEESEGLSTLAKVGLGVGALAVGAAILGAEDEGESDYWAGENAEWRAEGGGQIDHDTIDTYEDTEVHFRHDDPITMYNWATDPKDQKLPDGVDKWDIDSEVEERVKEELGDEPSEGDEYIRMDITEDVAVDVDYDTDFGEKRFYGLAAEENEGLYSKREMEVKEASRHHGGDKKKKLMKDNYENKWKKNLNDRFNKKTIADEDLRDFKKHGHAENFSAEEDDKAESKNLKMALGITAVGIGLAAILGKDKLSKLFDRFNL